jgi:hypothetical protein
MIAGTIHCSKRRAHGRLVTGSVEFGMYRLSLNLSMTCYFFLDNSSRFGCYAARKLSLFSVGSGQRLSAPLQQL